jgi:penicillin-binding protein 2
MEVGRSGLERGLEDRLRCREGRKEVERDARGRVIEVLEEDPPRDGETIRSSLSLPLQRTVTEALRAACAAHDAEGGAFVALDPANGEVLALASVGEGIHARLNLAVLPAVPGSTFKILTALAGLEAGTIDPLETFTCAGPWHGIGCSHSPGTVDLRDAISRSCNKYFARAAEAMGIGVFAPFAAKLGFGRPSGLLLPEESGGLVPDPEWKRRRYPKDPVLHVGELRQMGFGGGALLVTPVQMARLMAVVANGGRLVPPVLVLGEGGGGDRVVSEASAARVREAMEAVVTEGTGRRLGLQEFRVAGKTGTAELVADRQDHMAWFAGFAPAEAPRVAFACYLRRVKAHGAEAAGPVVLAFLREFFAR